jgi:hydrogenase expression/formation protein HypC
MCLGVPGKVVRTWQVGGRAMAAVAYGGTLRDCCVDLVPDLQVGDYTVIHLGFALQRLDAQTVDLMRELGLFVEADAL